MAKWNTTETGILRKKAAPEKLEELLVFGYACKLFRDDEKALFIDQGKHLIPWMGDENLKIDRYDCRGALSDLTPYESSREGYDAMRWLGISESERKIEQLCDEERYYALNTNVEEEEMYKEEELKRLQQKTNEFSYSYDVPQDPDVSRNPDPPTVEEEDREYVPPIELRVSADIPIPKTERENARIEKTAHFVSKQGPQMEILIKAKQSDNPQFSFLNQNDPLYKYYKHVLSAIKAGSYRVETLSKAEEPKREESEHDTGDGYYLHPSLQTSVQSQMSPQVPSVLYKPTADCAYSQLVNRIQGSQTEIGAQNKQDAAAAVPNQNRASYEQQQQYYQYYYAMQYYEYYKQMVAQFHSVGDTDGQSIPSHVQEQINAQAATFAQMAYAQYAQQQNVNNPYAQIVSNLQHNKDAANSLTFNVQEATGRLGDIAKAPVIYGQEAGESAKTSVVSASTAKDESDLTSGDKVQQRKGFEVTPQEQPKKALLSLKNYGSDSEENGATDEDEEMEEEEGCDPNNTSVNYRVPPDETKVIIDKMATYVAKNGTDFEDIVRAKGDSRFQFLNETHDYYEYYRHKIGEFTGTNRTEKKGKHEVTQQSTKPKEKKVITPVCFSIKKPKEEMAKDIRSALPVEESDEEAGEEAHAQSVQIQPNQTKAVSVSVTANVVTTPALTTSDATTTNDECLTPPRINELPAVVEQLLKDKVKKTESPEAKGDVAVAKNGTDVVDDPILEMIDLTDDIEERKDARRAEDKIKDKLAAAAREKLASAGKDRALQLERKKKAAAFLKLKSVETDTRVVVVEGGKEEKTAGDDRILIISDSENREEKNYRRVTRDKRDRKAEESDSEEGEIKRHRKSAKKKRSHKRKHSRGRRDSRSQHQHKKSKKRRRRSESYHSTGSTAS